MVTSKVSSIPTFTPQIACGVSCCSRQRIIQLSESVSTGVGEIGGVVSLADIHLELAMIGYRP